MAPKGALRACRWNLVVSGTAQDTWAIFDLATARWVRDELAADELPAAAVAALTAGADGDALRLLAAMDGSGWSEIEPVFQQVFAERGRPLPTRRQATVTVASDVLQEVAAERLNARDGTNRLRVLAWDIDDSEQGWKDLEPFISLSFDWDSADEGRIDPETVRTVTVETARELLARDGVSDH